ncbi:efflux RND transporter permease subunit [Stenotrophomonas maltophilia]|uniref:efflux RND transporter permease subunit n=1 Tax=Stenotrophomonas maltophilia TaxID=40324 RepID=UPI001AACAF5A|nr:efflux RND transporter permease subunit [Stenotrophomonas maltophilia]MBO2845126.1 efflux RND transporter permease subunit [Stenotrophomonas maltophilia]
MSVAEFSIRRPVTTIMCFVSLVVIGLIASFRLPLEALPDISAPFLFVQIPYTGSTPEEVERTIIRPVEESLATMTGIKRMRSSATSEAALIYIEFSDWDRDIAIAASDARERIDAIRSDLPDDLQRYNVFKWSSSDQPVLKVRLASTSDLTTAYDMLDREFKRRIERIPGVARVDITGAPPNEVEIAIDPNRLNAHGLSINELSERLRTLNFSISAGQIDDNGQRVRVQPVGEITDLQEMRDLVINAKGLRLGDIADVRLKPARMNYGRRLDGNPAVGLDIFKERSANLVDVSRAALAEVEAIRAQPSMRDVQIKVIDNQGKAVTSSLLELAEAGAVGLILSVTVLFFFLRHWPSTLMVTLAIPICFTITLGFMYFVGVTLNILTMMGLLLAVGMLVDNAVVVVESIYQERERMPGQPRLASIIGTRNVAIALSAGTLCHCIVFVPNLFGETNNISIFMAQIAITISVSLLASWLVAVSLIPMLSARMATPKLVHSQTGLIARLQRRYAQLLDWSLHHRGWSLLGILLVVLVSLVPMKLTKVDMFGGEGGKDIFIGYMWKGAYTYRQMSEEVARVESWIDQNRERLHVKQVYNQGGDGGGGGNQGVQVQMVGDSSSMLQEIGQEVVPLLAQRAELRDVRIDNGEKGGELKVRVDRERAAAFGFNAEQVASFVGLALRGAPMREFRRGDNEVPVWVRFAGAEQSSPEDLAGFSVRTGDGRSVPLLSLVTVDVGSSATQIGRTNRQTTLTIKANLAGKVTAPDGRKAIEAVLKPMNFPAGYGFTFDGGDYGNDDEAMQQMVFNLLIALVMIYVVMAAVFESLLFPAAIMSGVLFSIFGVFWLFWITGTSFGIMSFIGILVLMGVVVNNGIVMIEHINNLRRSGMGRTQALVEGSRERLRPIMMTMGTAILAMVPISLTDTQMFGNGPEYSPMARAIAGGLAFSTVVSLLFLPTIYAVLDDLRNAVTRLIRRARGVEVVAGTAV